MYALTINAKEYSTVDIVNAAPPTPLDNVIRASAMDNRTVVFVTDAAGSHAPFYALRDADPTPRHLGNYSLWPCGILRSKFMLIGDVIYTNCIQNDSTLLYRGDVPDGTDNPPDAWIKHEYPQQHRQITNRLVASNQMRSYIHIDHRETLIGAEQIGVTPVIIDAGVRGPILSMCTGNISECIYAISQDNAVCANRLSVLVADTRSHSPATIATEMRLGDYSTYAIKNILDNIYLYSASNIILFDERAAAVVGTSLAIPRIMVALFFYTPDRHVLHMFFSQLKYPATYSQQCTRCWGAPLNMR
jgi:hypothetical protein